MSWDRFTAQPWKFSLPTIRCVGVVSLLYLLVGTVPSAAAATVCETLAAQKIDLLNAVTATGETENKLKEMIACIGELRGDIEARRTEFVQLDADLQPFRKASVIPMRFGRNGPVSNGLAEVAFGVSNDGKPQDDEQVRVPSSESWSFCAITGMEVSDHSRASSCGTAQSSGGGWEVTARGAKCSLHCFKISR
jgi:hypothetical protein